MAEVPTVGSSGGCITYKYPSRISGFDLGAEIGRLVESSLAANTRDAYQMAILSFETFRVDYGLAQIWPPPIPHVTLFIAFLSLNRKAASTAANYIAAINFRCKFYQNYDISQQFIVKKMLEGMKRSKIVKDIRLPITLDLLNRIINQLPVICCSGYESTLFAAAFSVAYHGFFRVGEIAFTKPGQSHQILGIQDVNIIRKGAQYFINVHLLY